MEDGRDVAAALGIDEPDVAAWKGRTHQDLWNRDSTCYLLCPESPSDHVNEFAYFQPRRFRESFSAKVAL
jgi:hypothetical protein